MKKWLVFSILAVLSVLVFGCSSGGEDGASGEENSSTTADQAETTGGSDSDVIRLGLAPDEDSAAILRKFEPFINYLSEETSYEIEPYVGADYTAVIQAMDSGHLDIAWFGPSEYILATDQVSAGVEAFAQAIQTEDSMDYYTAFVVDASSDYEDLADLEGATLAFTDPASTSGHIFGRYSLVQEGIDPEDYFETIVYAGSHDAALLSVLEGEVDVAAISSRKIPGFIESGVIEDGDIRIIFESIEIPADPMTYRDDLPEEVKSAFKDALLNNKEAVSASLEGTEFSHFEEANDSDYDIVREAYEVADEEPES